MKLFGSSGREAANVGLLNDLAHDGVRKGSSLDPIDELRERVAMRAQGET